MGYSCGGGREFLTLRGPPFSKLLAYRLHSRIGQLVERQHDEHANVENHRHNAEKNFYRAQYLIRLHAVTGGIVNERQDPANDRSADSQTNFQAEEIG